LHNAQNARRPTMDDEMPAVSTRRLTKMIVDAPDPNVQRRVRLLAELADLLGQAGNLAARRPLVNDAALGGAHQLRLGGLEGGQRLLLVAAGDRVLDAAQVAAHARAPRLVDLGAARDLAARLLGGFGISHQGSVVARCARPSSDRRGSAKKQRRRAGARRLMRPLIVRRGGGVNACRIRQLGAAQATFLARA
jgi:hypothetical protein